MDPASRWHEWSVDQLRGCSERAPLHVNLMIYTELLIPGPDIEALDAKTWRGRFIGPAATT